ncbi:cell division protein FtsZ [Candidatus Electronema sp. PJ]|uniref:cell division protein FtsZ n=1 Tax=Candidatus Electronema sp. PJ TaxID=3401572 RepID=UPI003AA84B0A
MSYRMAEEKAVATIKVIGVGGGGGNAINTMVEHRLAGVQFIVANTDMQALEKSRADIRIQLGPTVTKGMGAGAEPEVGRKAAEESLEDLSNAIADADMVFVTAGLGGGTGTGAAPVIAKLSKEKGALTVAVVTKPFYFEAKKRMRNAEAGWEELKKNADTIITVPNDRLLGLMQKNSTLVEMMKMVDDVLLQAVKGITDLINLPGHINVDFADLKTVMKEVGPAIMGSGSASGENRAAEAAKRAIDNQLLEDVGIDGALGILINISATSSMTMNEFMEASALIQDKAHEDANIIIGALFDENMGDELRVTVIATGISKKEESDTISELDAVGRAGRKGATAKLEQEKILQEPERPLEHRAVSFARPNPTPKGMMRPMPTPVFDDQNDLAEWDEPAYIRKKAN